MKHLLRFFGRGFQFVLMSVFFFPILLLWFVLGLAVLVIETWEKTK